jgi:lipopolysaccharide export system permease protein
MKKLIFTKFFTDIIKAFFLAGVSLSIIVWVIQSVNYLDLVIEDGHGFDLYFSYTLLNFPKIFSRILPMLFFLTLFYKILEYEKKNELLIFWANGISKTQFTNMLILFSFLIYFFQIFLGGYIAPISQLKARSMLVGSNVDFFPSLIKEGKFIDTLSSLTIFIDKKIDTNQYQNIFLTEEKNNGIKRIIYSKSGYLDNNFKKKIFNMIDGNMIDQDNKKSTIIQFDKLSLDLSKYSSKSITFPKIQETGNYKLSKCLLYNYQNRIKDFKESNFNCELSTIDNVSQELLRRFYLPIYLPLIALLCCGLFIRSKEKPHYEKFKYCLFFLVFFILVLSEISLKYFLSNIYSLIFFSLFPIIMFSLAYLIVTFEKKHD